MIRLEPDAEGDAIAAVLASETVFVGRTRSECSVIAPLAALRAQRGVRTPQGSDSPGGATVEAFRLLSIDAVFGTTETGILLDLLAPLAAARVWVLAVGTHDTDHVLVRSDQLDDAIGALLAAGWPVVEAEFPV